MRAEPGRPLPAVDVRGERAPLLKSALRERGLGESTDSREALIVVVLEEGRRLSDLVDPDQAYRTVGMASRDFRAPGVVEVVSTYQTCLESVAEARALVRALGLKPVRRADRAKSLYARLWEVSDADALDRLVAAARLVDEGLSSSTDVETVARRELGWSESPFAPLRAREGIEELMAEIRRRGRRVPFTLRRQARSSTSFGAPDLETAAREGSTLVTLQRPATLNALDPSFLAQLEETLYRALEGADGNTLRLRSTGRAFLAGVDSGWILSRMEENDLESILDLVHRGQALFHRLASSEVSVEVEVDGLAAGAGVELMGWADRVITTAQARFVMPETSIGITPALGGTQVLPRRIGLPLARWMLLTGDFVSAGRARALGLSHEAPFVDDRGLDALAACFDPAHSLEQLQQPREDFERWVRRSCDLDDEGWRWVRRAHDQILHRAPLALHHTDRLLLASPGLELEEGLAAEIEALPEIFHSQDALRGVRAAAEGRRARRFAGD